jgi:hypothetical protein
MIAGQEIVFADHAVARFHERVRPALELKDAARQLESLANAGELTIDPPPWLAISHPPADAYLVMGDVVLPLRADCRRPGVLVAMTTRVRGSISAPSRRRRNRRRRPRRGAMTARARPDPWCGASMSVTIRASVAVADPRR